MHECMYKLSTSTYFNTVISHRSNENILQNIKKQKAQREDRQAEGDNNKAEKKTENDKCEH